MYIDKSIEERDRPDDPPPIEQDDERLKQLGIRREMKREFTNFTTISFALGILGWGNNPSTLMSEGIPDYFPWIRCSASIASTFITPLLLGGPATAIWAWFLGSFGSFALAASVAELVSAYPTAGGIYTCTAFLIPKKYRSIIPFLSAWITVVGQLATPASVTFAPSQMVFGAVTISTDGAFIASKGQTLGLYVGLTVGLGIFNTLPTKFLHRITFFYVFVNIATSIAIIIAIPTAGAKNLASHRFVWTSVVDHSGWNNPPFAFLLGILSVAWVMVRRFAFQRMEMGGMANGTETSTRRTTTELLVRIYAVFSLPMPITIPSDLNEEVRNAAIATPVAINTKHHDNPHPVSVCHGFFVNIALCYGIRDFASLPGPTGLAFSQILWDNLGKRGALALWSFNALPDGKILSKVWNETKTPINAVVFTVIIATLFGLLYLASFVAINAIFSITAVALDISYMVTHAIMKLSWFMDSVAVDSHLAKVSLWMQKNPKLQFTPGPFSMGKWGYAVNIYAILWTCLETGVLIMPQVFPITDSTMNYAGPIIGGVCGVSWIWYKLHWHRHYVGPGSSDAPDLAWFETGIDEKARG
ncbi:hypothetical protein BD410DRAFT_801917 [Rickenella mellea]|uniref:APC amino acid permease n=1 Tax=Rickenella mellea TaxID=50990 RepID=A0A4Y7QAG6_9AGAM|nr:hypothetical protein BD410DRAFT_801917 [Rickenella mellea]